MEVTAITSL